MVIKRKLFSKEVERKKSDKGWDAALGAGIGATAGVAGKMKLEKINSIKKLKNATNIAIAQIIIHEVIHAYLTNLYKTEYETYKNSYQKMFYAYAGGNLELGQVQHDEMVRSFTTPIADALKQYGKSIGLNINDDVYGDLAWAGLDYIHNSSLSDEEKDRIQNRISAEFKNTIFDTEVPMGEKACK